MGRRSQRGKPEDLRRELVQLLSDFEAQLELSDLRAKVLALVPVHDVLRDLGSNLIPEESAESGRGRIIAYMLRFPGIVIDGKELTVVSGIGDWPRRVRELRVQFGWPIASGKTINEMRKEDELGEELSGTPVMKPDQYILMRTEQDTEAAHRWNVANEIRRRKDLGTKERILAFLRENVGKPVTNEELRYVAKDSTEWARRTRELRTEEGWPVTTKSTGMPDLAIGHYLLMSDRQLPRHDRRIPDPVRRAVLRRDGYACVDCHWSHEEWTPSDPSHLELHHTTHHVGGGENTEENLVTLCNNCHGERHRR